MATIKDAAIVALLLLVAGSGLSLAKAQAEIGGSKEEIKRIIEKKRELLAEQNKRILFTEELLQKVFNHIPTKTFSTEVTVTAYTASPEETNSEPWFTADMSLSRVGMIAVSRDLLNVYGLEYGDTVILDGYGAFMVHDTMNKRYNKRVDIMMAHKKSAIKFGVRTTTLIWTGES